MAISWTTVSPVEAGDYYFRSTKDKPAQVVAVKDGIVTFQSGKKKRVSHIQGEWGGVIKSSVEPFGKHTSSSSTGESWRKKLEKFLLPILGFVIGTILHDPYLTFVDVEKGPKVEEDVSVTPHRISITVFPIFRNWGTKPGHIEKAVFSHRELHAYPDDVQLNYCEKTPITLASIYEGKRIVCNFVATIDPQKTHKEPAWFQVSYFGPGDHEIYTQTFEAVPLSKSAENTGGK